jgi:VRR-NUC domain
VKLAETMTEREYQTLVVDWCKWHNLLIYHTYDSRRSQAGFPDLVVVGNRVIWVELKSAKGRLSHTQNEWLLRLQRAGQEVYLWRPCDWGAAQHILDSLTWGEGWSTISESRG